MMPNQSKDQSLQIYLALAQYPILRTNIRERMRQMMFDTGVISPKKFEKEVRQQALRSQQREGLDDPFSEETAETWEIRLSRVRDYLTDYYFGYNLPLDRFHDLVKETLAKRSEKSDQLSVSFNPEIAPVEMLFDHAQAISKLPAGEAQILKPRLEEIIVVLIRKIISDHLAYINIAKEWFQLEDLVSIQKRKIGYGKIGGKAAGMLLAARILEETLGEELDSRINIPISYYIGAGVMYTFMSYNNLVHWNNQKYRSTEKIYSDFPTIQEEYARGEFPPDIEERLKRLLEKEGNKPLIVRSSSLLEDNFGTSFAGKYESIFCPNQSSLEDNYQALTNAISQVYASAMNPDAILYRRKQGLLDYDERLAVLIQVVQGEKFQDYYFPQISGVGFSRNLYRWTPKIDKEAGFLRLVWGLGTRAVDRLGEDYPRLVALSHPNLRPEKTYQDKRRYTQHQVDLINLDQNALETHQVADILHPDYPVLRYLAQIDEGGYLTPIRSKPLGVDPNQFIITFDGLLHRTPFAGDMKKILTTLEEKYQMPVDTEFTVDLDQQENPTITLLQCRPQSHSDMAEVEIPDNIPEQDIIFNTSYMIPRGKITGIRYVLFVSPEAYYSLPSQAERLALGRTIGRVNAALEGETFICVGPGRWGTNNPDLGIRVSYSDIYHCRALIEVSGKDVAMEPDFSFGTHFFQDLVEAEIYPLAVYLDDPETIFKRDFFYGSPNDLTIITPQEEQFADTLHLINVEKFRPGHRLDLLMSEAAELAVAYYKPIR